MHFTRKPSSIAARVTILATAATALNVFPLVDALPVFGTTIPNGETVPCLSKPSSSSTMNQNDRDLHGGETHIPGCSSDGFCLGLGHLDCGGGMEEDKTMIDVDGDGPTMVIQLNPFGEDYRSNGYAWTKELCELDSDGDGFTNGEELGDPCCVWTKQENDYEGSSAKKTAAAILDSFDEFSPSHPGFKDSVPPSGFSYDKTSLCNSGGDGGNNSTSGGRKNSLAMTSVRAYHCYYATIALVGIIEIIMMIS